MGGKGNEYTLSNQRQTENNNTMSLTNRITILFIFLLSSTVSLFSQLTKNEYIDVLPKKKTLNERVALIEQWMKSQKHMFDRSDTSLIRIYMEMIREGERTGNDYAANVARLGLSEEYLIQGKMEESYRLVKIIGQGFLNTPNSMQMHLYLLRFNYWLKKSDIAQTEAVLELMRSWNKENYSESVEASILMATGRKLLKQRKFEEAISTFYRTIKLTDKINRKLTQFLLYAYISDCYQELGDFDRSRESLLKAAQIAYKYGGESEKATTLNHLAVLEYMQGNYQASLDNFQKILQLRKAEGVINEVAKAYYNLGMVYFGLERYAESEEYFSKMNEICAKYELLDLNKDALLALVDIAKKLGRKDQVIKLYEDYIAIHEEVTNNQVVSNAEFYDEYSELILQGERSKFEKKEAMLNEKLRRSNNRFYFLTAGVVLVSLFFLVYLGWIRRGKKSVSSAVEE